MKGLLVGLVYHNVDYRPKQVKSILRPN